ncbi:hypothetical protein BDV96DRAFT_75117 [Lophiotrema nucula]|uniref:Uncharacterized protein n=1 Tax=Lophiotrema nucula TaxID=690887 RepID=A0A6A5Z797_9PLEO|nr:hypothetical protein BDV96DRAFT_75117 [Lophiotrema nucula]
MLLDIITVLLITPLASAIALQPRRPAASGFINAHTWTNNALGPTVGYLNADGRLTSSSSSRAKFTLKEDEPWTASTSNGECGFHDPNEPKNEESSGGVNWTAFRCKSGIQIVGYPDQLGIDQTPTKLPDGTEVTYIYTQSGSGVNSLWFSVGLPAGTEAKDVFTRGPPGTELGEGRVELRFVWESA